MSKEVNGQWRLHSRPEGMVKPSNFEYVEEPVPQSSDGEMLIRNLYFGFEPAMRLWLNDVEGEWPPVGIGEVMRSLTVGQVMESKHPGFTEGDIVSGLLGWQDYAVSNGKSELIGTLNKMPPVFRCPC